MKRKLSSKANVDLSTAREATICAIYQHPKRSDRWIVRLENNGEVVHKLLITDEALVQRSLRIGQVINTDLIAELAELADSCRTLDSAFASLALRSRARGELERLLRQKGFEARHIDSALERLASLGLLDDAQFARGFVRSRVLGRGTSTMALRRDLARKGVPRETADAAIAEVMDEQSVDELAVARAEAVRRWRALERLAPEVAKRRLIGFLQRRGFPSEIVRAVVREVAGR